jgi:hypothetical protein
MRRICGNVYRLAGSRRALLPAEDRFHLAFEEDKCLFEVMTVEGRSAAGRDVHIDQAKRAGGSLPRNGDRLGVTYQTDVRQVFICIRTRERKRTVEIIGRQNQLLLRCSGHEGFSLISWMMDPGSSKRSAPAAFTRKRLATRSTGQAGTQRAEEHGSITPYPRTSAALDHS